MIFRRTAAEQERADQARRKNTLGMLQAMATTGRPMYEGTVTPAVIAKRRARNKAARHARKAARR